MNNPVENPPLELGDDDLFVLPPVKPPHGPHTGRDHPETSHKAADTIRPALPTIRAEVLRYAEVAGPPGFIDDDLVRAHPDNPESSYRKRRSELTEECWILDSGRRRLNRDGNECVVWVHRDFVLQPPAVRQPQKKPAAGDVGAAFATLRRWARQMRNEGRLFVPELDGAIDTLESAAKGR